MDKSPKILYAAQLNFGSTSHSRMLALEDLGYELIKLDYNFYFEKYGYIIKGLQFKYLAGPSIININKKLLKLDKDYKPDIIWIDKGLYIKAATIEKLKKNKRFLILHNTDDITFKPHNFGKNVILNVPYFDVVITSNVFNINDFKLLSAQNVIHMELAYNHHLHEPKELSKEDYEKYKADVSFIGHWEEETEKFIVGLRERGIKVRLLGTGWENANDSILKRANIPGVFGEEYVKALCASKINLCFLSKWNRNVTAARSFEIPACKTFMLGERTDAHIKYFEERKEAEFFSDVDELEKKIRYYLDNEDARRRVAEAGYQRCISSGYSDLERMKNVMKQVFNICNNG